MSRISMTCQVGIRQAETGRFCTCNHIPFQLCSTEMSLVGTDGVSEEEERSVSKGKYLQKHRGTYQYCKIELFFLMAMYMISRCVSYLLYIKFFASCF